MLHIPLTQEELADLIRHMQGIAARYESETGAFLAIADECPSAKDRAVERLSEADSAAALLDKLLHI